MEKYFCRMGARVKFARVARQPRAWPTVERREDPEVTLDIGRDRQGDFFEVRTLAGARAELVVLNARPRERHLLLLSRQLDASGNVRSKQKFLCGSDEGHWFVAAIPEDQPVSTVAAAQIALKPREVRGREEALGVRRREGFRRKNAAFQRQGEWFFLPAGRLEVPPLAVLRDEPLSRGNGSKPHWAELCYRTGGETVYVSARYPRGLTAGEFAALPEAQKRSGFRSMRRDAVVYVRGRITHPDHRPVQLEEWHRVLMNTEHRAAAMQFLAFLD